MIDCLGVTQQKRMIVAFRSTQSTQTHSTRLNTALAVKTSTFGKLIRHHLFKPSVC